MDEVFEAIREDDLRSLALEISDYSDQISEIFDKIDLKIDELVDVYRGEPCAKLLDKYESLHCNFKIIKNNINSYSEDLISLIRKMKESDKNLSILFQNYTNDTLDKIKSIME